MLGEGELDSTEIASESLPAGKLRWSSVESTIASNCVCFNNVASSPVARLKVCSQRTNWTELNWTELQIANSAALDYVCSSLSSTVLAAGHDVTTSEERVVASRVNGSTCYSLVRVSSVQFMCCEQTLILTRRCPRKSPPMVVIGCLLDTQNCVFFSENKTNHVISERWQKSDPMTDLTAVTSTLDKSTD